MEKAGEGSNRHNNYKDGEEAESVCVSAGEETCGSSVAEILLG